MKKIEIEEGNKIIATFCKNEYIEHADAYIYQHPDFRSYASWKTKHLRYHASYDWLMKAINKIQEVWEEPEELDDLKEFLWRCEIIYVWEECVDLIKLYNETK